MVGVLPMIPTPHHTLHKTHWLQAGLHAVGVEVLLVLLDVDVQSKAEVIYSPTRAIFYIQGQFFYQLKAVTFAYN